MTPDELSEIWEKDSKIDKTKLDEESANIPVLHHKYQNFLMKEAMQYKLLGIKKRNLENKLKDYYEGKIDGKDIGREPWQLTETQTTIEKRIKNDKEYANIEIVMIQIEEKIKFLQGVITNINQRNYQIKNILEFWRWTSGSL